MPKVSQLMAKNGCFDQEVVFKHEVSSINRDGSTGVSPSNNDCNDSDRIGDLRHFHNLHS